MEIEAAALNFRDLMKVLGLYPQNPGVRPWLGDECAGRVTRIGAAVRELRPGDEVVAICTDAFATFGYTRTDWVTRKPAHLSFAEAAALPIAFLTALYSLRDAARLASGESVLIHSASGGVGLAAVQVALRTGGRVIATCGNERKREYVRALGVEHVLDSRTVSFTAQVQEITGGRGVDVVLNSLPGPMIAASLECLGSFGRLIEIGKRDIAQNTPVGLSHLRRNRLLRAVDLELLLLERPGEGAALLSEMARLFEARALQPLPVTTFGLAQLGDALRYMTERRHIGKIVLSGDRTGRQGPLATEATMAHPAGFSGT